jgi:CheY-like chemotaxis protein
MAMVDPGQMSQVILNLSVNARDAMPRGGTLTIATRAVEVTADNAAEHPGVPRGEQVVLTVSDTGIGMDAATQARIFEPFFTTKETGAGTGLGLATVFGIVEQSGGTILTASELGRGTTFKIYLPRLAAVPAGAPGTAARRRSKVRRGGGETILLVEDDDAVRAMVRSVLEKSGYRLVEAANGRAALALCDSRAAQIDLVITDMVMPEMGGREFALRLEAIRPGIKVLYMSGYTNGVTAGHGVLEPGIAFVQKPLVASALVEKVQAMLSGATPRASRAGDE